MSMPHALNSGLCISGSRPRVLGLQSRSIKLLIQNVTKSYCKVWQVLKRVTGITKSDIKLLQSVTRSY